MFKTKSNKSLQTTNGQTSNPPSLRVVRPRRISKSLRVFFGMPLTFAKTLIKNHQADLFHGLGISDVLVDYAYNKGNIVDHSRKAFNNGASINESLSTLPRINFYNKQGNHSVSYEHYDKFSNSIDINFGSEITHYQKRPEDSAIQAKTYRSATVILTEYKTIDFSMPENLDLLDHKEVIGEILIQHPEAFESLPLDVLEPDPKFFASKFSEGVNRNVSRANFGVDENGNALDESGYLTKMTKMSSNKRKAFQNLRDARHNFVQEINEEY